MHERSCGDYGNGKAEEIKELDSIFPTFKDGKQMIMDADPNVERAMQVKRHIEMQ